MKAQRQLQADHPLSARVDDTKSVKSLRLTDEQEHALVERAQVGDVQAREAIILSLQSWLRYVAEKCSHAYNWKSVLLESADLIQMGNIVLMERLDHALTTERPFAYLTAAVIKALRCYCSGQGTGGTIPKRMAGVESFHVSSFDILMAHNGDGAFLSTLATSGNADDSTSGREDQISSSALYQAVASLPDRQQEIIIRLFGLYGMPSESLSDISRALYGSKAVCGAVSHHRNKALTALRHMLSSINPKDSKE